MEDKRAVEIIRMAEHEEAKAANFKSLYQEVADLMYPCENQITTKGTPGQDKSRDIRDPTGIIGLDKGTSGFIAEWIPKDRQFCGILVKNKIVAELDHIKRWCSIAVRILHEELFESNYMQQLQQTIKATMGFGTGCSFSEWNSKTLGLNFKDYHISTYTIKQNAQGRVDTMILTYEQTARQVSGEFANPGEQVLKAVSDTRTESDLFKIIHIVRPRIERNVMFVDNLNMPFESVFVNVKEKIVIDEGGFEEFPFAVPRWEKSSFEKYGRGRGTVMLSAVKELQQMRKDLVECGNRWNNPSRWQIDDDIEGTLNNSPGALNHYFRANAAGSLDSQLNGNFPITKDILEFQQNFIKNEGFYNDIFLHFRNLKGDRRNELELTLKNEEGLDQLVAPVINIESEFFTPQLTRSILLLIRNGRIPPPPPELRGQLFGIEYMGKLAMAVKQYQARGFMQFSEVLGALNPIFPEAKDMINVDRALPDIAIAMGVKTEHLSTPEEIVEKRAKRAQDELEQKLAMAAQVGAEAYNKVTKAPEAGSPAEMVGV